MPHAWMRKLLVALLTAGTLAAPIEARADLKKAWSEVKASAKSGKDKVKQKTKKVLKKAKEKAKKVKKAVVD